MVQNRPPHLKGKLDLVRIYKSQLQTGDYLNYSEGLARVRAFHTPVTQNRPGAVEAYLAMPNRDYCDLVLDFAGNSGKEPSSGVCSCNPRGESQTKPLPGGCRSIRKFMGWTP